MKKIFLFFLLPVAACQVSAESLSLDSCITMALQNNRQLVSSQKLAEKYKYEVKAYRANFFPNFKLMANDAWSSTEGTMNLQSAYLPTYSYNAATGSLTPNVLTDALGNVVMNGSTPVFTSYAYFPGVDIDYKIGNIFQAGLSLEQPLYMGGKIVTAYKMAKLGREMAQYGEQLSQSQVIVKVQEAYALLVRADEMHKVAVQYDSLLQVLLTDVQNAEKRGLRSHNDVLKVQVKVSEARLQVRQAENGQRLAAMNLCHCIGLPLTTEVEAETESITAHPQTWADPSATVTDRPEYHVLQLKSELASRQVKLERSEYLPEVVLGASYSYLNGIEVLDKKLLSKPSLGVLLLVKIPLYHANEGFNKVRAARLEAERTQLEQEDLEEQLNLELAQAANNLDEAYLEVGLAEQTLAQAEENLRSSRGSFDQGMESLSDLLEAQTLWQQAYAKLANARTNLFVAATKYKKASGKM